MTSSTPCSKSGGVVSDFAVWSTGLPVVSSTANVTKSVNVPPTSVATRTVLVVMGAGWPAPEKMVNHHESGMSPPMLSCETETPCRFGRERGARPSGLLPGWSRDDSLGDAGSMNAAHLDSAVHSPILPQTAIANAEGSSLIVFSESINNLEEMNSCSERSRWCWAPSFSRWDWSARRPHRTAYYASMTHRLASSTRTRARTTRTRCSCSTSTTFSCGPRRAGRWFRILRSRGRFPTTG